MEGNISEWTAAEVQTVLKDLDLETATLDILTDVNGAMIRFFSPKDFTELKVPIKDRVKIQDRVSREIEKEGAQLKDIQEKNMIPVIINVKSFPSVFRNVNYRQIFNYMHMKYFPAPCSS